MQNIFMLKTMPILLYLVIRGYKMSYHEKNRRKNSPVRLMQEFLLQYDCGDVGQVLNGGTCDVRVDDDYDFDKLLVDLKDFLDKKGIATYNNPVNLLEKGCLLRVARGVFLGKSEYNGQSFIRIHSDSELEMKVTGP